ncbi:cellulose binding domain-containing protein [Kibdelosporangium lantanae]|uniref:Cellulose binding domain-containing protein n=1 Tax=Kibdelosporangium lantanae TaxID=1497396 RepID=A0ABW3MK44_9PSEU
MRAGVEGCEAHFEIKNSWPNGYEALVTVRASAKPLKGWTVSWTLPGGQSIKQLWNGTLSVDGEMIKVEPADWNVRVDGTTNFGLLADTNGPHPVTPQVACTSP